METIYRGYEIAQPQRYFKHRHTAGSGSTSLTVRTHNIGTEEPAKVLKTFTFKRHNTKELETAFDKARTFIDDLHLHGKQVEILQSGNYKHCFGEITGVNRRKVNNKHLLFITVTLSEFDNCSEDAPPAVTLKGNEFRIL